MKKIPVFFLVLLLTLSLSAQQNFIGIKAGISIPNLTAGSGSGNPINTGYHSRLGADMAVFFEWGLSSRFSMMPSVQYSSQGGKKNGFQAFTTPASFVPFFPPGQAPPYLYADYRSEAKMNYLMLVLPAKAIWPLGKSKISLTADAGPFVSLLLNAHQVTRGASMIYADEQMKQPMTPVAQSFDQEKDIREDLHKVNAGAAADIGLSRSLRNGKLFLEAGFNYGFINIQKDAMNGKNQTGAAIFRLGYAFCLQTKK